MAVRARKKTKSTKKAAVKKKTPAKKKSSPKNLSPNAKIHLETYKSLEKKLGDCWEKLCKDVKKRDRKAIAKDRADMMLLLGECNYMARECANCMEKPKRKTRR